MRSAVCSWRGFLLSAGDEAVGVAARGGGDGRPTMWCGGTSELHGDDLPDKQYPHWGAHIADGVIFGEYSSRLCGISFSHAPSNSSRLAILAQR